jgi:hypothetical protein
MCTNDFYICKDSSRINCTLACSTLGYIPCKNYVDKKVCSRLNINGLNSPSLSGRTLFNTNKQHLLFGHDGEQYTNLFSKTFLFLIRIFFRF